jgi:hypothetical protein
MPMSREQARAKHTRETGHEQFTETVYGVICTMCHNYVLIDHTNCPSSCRTHVTCCQANS